jgi:hypothetical protein
MLHKTTALPVLFTVFFPTNRTELPRPLGLYNYRTSRLIRHTAELERVMGIEPTSKAWEAFVLPLNYTRKKSTLLRPDRAC